MKPAIVIIPTTGSPGVRTAINACLAPDYPGERVLGFVDAPEQHRALENSLRGLDGNPICSGTLRAHGTREGF
jgi:hypothetical protein